MGRVTTSIRKEQLYDNKYNWMTNNYQPISYYLHIKGNLIHMHVN